jgi:hypothetical protein
MAADEETLDPQMEALRQWVESMDADAFARLQTAIETGRWTDGVKLTAEQRAYAMQAYMLYQAWRGGSDEHLTIGADGHIIHKPKSVLKNQFRNEPPIARFDHDDL